MEIHVVAMCRLFPVSVSFFTTPYKKMELRQLQSFARVAQLKSFSEAARTLYITQSTLSQQIRQLEGEIGVPLFVRTTHSVELTDYGEELLPAVQRVLAEATSCQDRITDVNNLNVGHINIGCTYTFLPLLKETLHHFLKNFPGIRVHIVCHSVERLMEMLLQREVDVVLGLNPTHMPEGLESQVLFNTRLCVVMSDTHPLAQSRSLRFAEIEHHPLALPSKGLQARSSFDLLTQGLDYQFDVRLEVNDINMLISMVRSTRLITFLAEAAVNTEPGIRTVPLERSGIMEGAFTIRKGCYTRRATKEFLRILSERGAMLSNAFF